MNNDNIMILVTKAKIMCIGILYVFFTQRLFTNLISNSHELPHINTKDLIFTLNIFA